MYLPLILFFTSLFGIIFMIGRKLLLQGAQYENHNEELLFEIPHPEEIKKITIRSVQKYGYITLVTTIKLYVRSVNIVKNSYRGIKNKISNINKKYISKQEIENKEKRVSKFLKMISEYKEKIREIKHKIHEEENNK